MNLSGLGILRLFVVLMFLACAVMAQTNDKVDLGIGFKPRIDCSIYSNLQISPTTNCFDSQSKDQKNAWYQFDPQNPAQNSPQNQAPSSQNQGQSDPQNQTPDPQNQTPDPQNQTPDPQNQTPDPQNQTPDPQNQAQPDPQNQTPDPQNGTPKKQYDPSNINPITGVSYVSQTNYQPLTGKDRLHLFLKQTFMPPSAYLGSLFNAAVDVIHHDPPEWQLGAAGYGRRLALRLGNNLVQNSVQTLEAAALHEDQRYIVSQGKGFMHRVGHAFAYTFVTYNNNGNLTPNIAFVTSIYAGTMITTYGLPKRYSPLGDGVRDGNMQMVFTSVYNIVEEFWPDIMRMFKH